MGALEFIHDKAEFIKRSREGITKSTFQLILDKTGITLTEMSRLAHVSARSIQMKKGTDRLSTDVSAKALTIARLYARGEEVFGNEDKFRKWMNTENMAMGGVAPISFLDLIEGINLVMDELTAIDHGFAA